jgi:hypothetical protein
MADAPDLGSGVAIRGGSSPLSPTSSEPLKKREAHPDPTSTQHSGGDDWGAIGAGATPRERLVTALCAGLAELINTGDTEGARIAMAALETLQLECSTQKRAYRGTGRQPESDPTLDQREHGEDDWGGDRNTRSS